MASAYDIEAGVPLRDLGPSGSSQPLSQPLGNTITDQPQPRHDGLYARILEHRQTNGQELVPDDELYGTDEIEKVAIKGFPTITAFTTKYPNTRICRAFDAVTQRLMATYQCQITCLFGALMDLDAEGAIESELSGEQGSQPTPFDKEKFISRCLRSPDQISLVRVPTRDEGSEEDDEQKRERIDATREYLIANLERILGKQRNGITWQYELNKIPRVSQGTHKRYFEHIKNIDGLVPDTVDYLRAYDDHIYPDGDPLYDRFYIFLIYIRGAFVRSIKYLSCKTIFGDEDVSFGKGAYDEVRIRLFVKSQMVLVGSALFLTPVGILYLGELTKGVAFAVVALFGFAFAFTLIAFNNQMLHVLLGIGAYYAVNVSFLT
ncbi:hypothetical protein F4803DRAFT_551139 [Xylaria telfairii]|nr:hypothetical protein F4803DRAFT_551139 [Xylaria telfairii]